MRASLPQVNAPKPKTSTPAVWFLVAIPAAVILGCGILILVYQQSAFDVAMGVVVVGFCAAIGAGAAVTLTGLRKDRRLAALQLDFVSKVSHELKTPLTSIRMFVDTLRLGRVSEPEKVEECLDVISKETDRLSQLIGRLLSWGAMEAGAFRVRLVERSPGDVVRAALRMFEVQALAAKVEIDLNIADGLPSIEVDETALIDALLNLLSNAVRYGGDDKLIRISVNQEGDDISIAVADRGIGIEFKHHSEIFERFYRADETYARAAGGTGLGLAIARHVVLAHGGTIDVDSKLGKGSTFTIRLPIRRAERGERAPTDQPGASS